MESAEAFVRERAELADSLGRLRRAAGLSGLAAGARVGASQSRISKIETGRLLPTVDVVERLADAYGAGLEVRVDLVGRAAALHRHDERLRMLRRRGVDRFGRDAAAHDAVGRDTRRRPSATLSLRIFQPAMVPGLLQTAEYARSLLGRPNCAASGDVPGAVAAVVGGQSSLYDEGNTFRFLMTEGMLRWRLCADAVMRAQLDRLAVLSTLHNVSIGVIPFSARVREVPLHGFTVRDRRAVSVEGFTTRSTLSDPRDVALYLEIFAMFERAAVFGSEVRELLAEIGQAYGRWGEPPGRR
ncbi:MAG: helix-turn-helix domain-containing protein [Carbonactinosporaceae bacterium]